VPTVMPKPDSLPSAFPTSSFASTSYHMFEDSIGGNGSPELDTPDISAKKRSRPSSDLYVSSTALFSHFTPDSHF